MSSLSQYDGWTAEDIQRKHGCDALTAMHVIQARAYIKQLRAQQRADLYSLTQHLDEAQKIGRLVLAAQRAGRKTVRIADLIEETP